MNSIQLPIKIDKDIQYFTLMSENLTDKIVNIKKIDNIPNHNQVFVYFKNGYSVSILQGLSTFNEFEIAVKDIDEQLLDYFNDDMIYRTNDTNEIISIMNDVSNIQQGEN